MLDFTPLRELVEGIRHDTPDSASSWHLVLEEELTSRLHLTCPHFPAPQANSPLCMVPSNKQTPSIPDCSCCLQAIFGAAPCLPRTHGHFWWDQQKGNRIPGMAGYMSLLSPVPIFGGGFV